MTIDTMMAGTRPSTTPHATTLPTPNGTQPFYSTAHLSFPSLSSSPPPNGRLSQDEQFGRLNTTSLPSNEPFASPDLPMIQFLPHKEGRPNRPSLDFQPISRTLPHGTCIIRVGRYSERDSSPELRPNIPSDAPIGFKSKVVSRRHCEFSYTDSQWYIKDVKSSSGTFLNHIRLSQPGVESRPFPVNDGDIVQLGIDFKGGEEMIYRCVKIRIECNRGWQKSLNKFNKTTHKRLKDMAVSKETKDSDVGSKHSTECTICLNSISPCQALFVAPCSHTWHYKCIRKMLDQTHSHFLCPNCRARADLDADVDEPLDFGDGWDTGDELERHHAGDTIEIQDSHSTPSAMPDLTREMTAAEYHDDDDQELTRSLAGISLHDISAVDSDNPFRHLRGPFDPSYPATSVLTRQQVPSAEPPTIPSPLSSANAAASIQQTRFPIRIDHTHLQPIGSLSATVENAVRDGSDFDERFPNNESASLQSFSLAPDVLQLGNDGGPMTPRNTAGPFVLDGNDGREQNASRGSGDVTSV